ENAKIAEWIKTQTQLKTVFLAGIWTVYARKGFLAEKPETAGFKPQPGFKDTIDLLHGLKTQIVIIEDVPFFPADVASCAARSRMFGRDDSTCLQFSSSQFRENEKQAAALLTAAVKRFDIQLTATSDAFCDAEFCTAEKDGAIFYRDNNHL